MFSDGKDGEPDRVIDRVNQVQMEHFTGSDPRCRGVQLPDGLMLRYMLSSSMYFYLRTGLRDGKIWSCIFASNCPYDPQKASIGEVFTPMFSHEAEVAHLRKVEKLVRSWILFVAENPDEDEMFKSFKMGDTHE